MINHSFKSPGRNNVRGQLDGSDEELQKGCRNDSSYYLQQFLSAEKLHNQIMLLGSNHYLGKVNLLRNFYSNGRLIRKAGLGVVCYTCNV